VTDTTRFTAACLQVNATEDMGENIATVQSMVRDAKSDGADMVFMPENVSMMTWGRRSTLEKAYEEADHPALQAFRDLAVERDIWLHCGSLTVLLRDTKVANRTYVISPDGGIAATYDKIHMFDVDLGEGERYAESSTFQPGERAVVVDLPWGRLGLTICYDLRFPYLYRALAKAGAQMITVPSAFTKPTGEAHWHVLQRARAIENMVYLLSPAQTGVHANDRKTYGHAVIVDPWGQIVAEADTAPGVIMAELDMALVDKTRKKIPSLTNDREFAAPSPL